jgi:Cd2+/Zn2+-exporting ATPase
MLVVSNFVVNAYDENLHAVNPSHIVMIGRYTTESLGVLDRGALLRAAAGGAALVASVALRALLGAGSPWGEATALLSLGLTGLPIVLGAARGLLRLQTNVDELVSLALVASVVLGEYVVAAVVAFLMVVGSLLEEYTSGRARRHIEKIIALHPRHAVLLRAGKQVEVPADSLRPGDRILIRPGDIVPADGTVASGVSRVDESSVSGESAPVDKEPGDEVCAGTANDNGALEVTVARVGQESTHGRIVALIEAAERHRAPIMRTAERYARWFTPVIVVLAAAVWLVTHDLHRAVTMLIVGCPCAFVLATPTAAVAAMARAARAGVLIKGGQYLEACRELDTVIFDKTGTLTTGQPRVVQVLPLAGAGEQEVLRVAALVERNADHPLGRAVLQSAAARGALPKAGAADTIAMAGAGISGLDGASRIAVGSERLLERLEVDLPPAASSQAQAIRATGRTVLYVVSGDSLIGLISVEDAVREEAAECLERLRAMGVEELHMLTGDAPEVAAAVARAAGLPAHAVGAGMLPGEKQKKVRELQRQGRRVCFVGDGANDGPALAEAHVGVSIGSRGNTVALETADIVLMRDGLQRLPFALALGRRTVGIINQNLLLFGLLYNVALLALSAMGVLTPILGAVGHNVGSVAVVLNSARLLRVGRAPRP